MPQVRCPVGISAVAASVWLVSCAAQTAATPRPSPGRDGTGDARVHYGLQLVAPPPTLLAQAPHLVVMFPDTDIVTVSGYAPGTRLRLEVFRQDALLPADPTDPVNPPAVKLGTAIGVVDGTGSLFFNHPGGPCFTDATPDLLPGDIARLTPLAADGTALGPAEEAQAANLRAGAPSAVGNLIVVRGMALALDGHQFPVAQLQDRLISSAASPFDVNGRRDIRTAVGGGAAQGTLAYDAPDNPASPTNGNWTATYAGLGAADIQRALAATGNISWVAPAPAGTQSIGENFGGLLLGGPFALSCAPYAFNGIKSPAGPLYLNQAWAAAQTPITLLGQVQDNVASVAVFIQGVRHDVVPSSCLPGGPRTWSLVLPAAAWPAVDGPVSFDALYTLAGVPTSTLRGAPFTIVRDTVPPAVTVTPTAPTFVTPFAASLACDDPTASLYYTTDGTTPTTSSAAYAGPIPIAATTTLKYLAVDPAGNTTNGAVTYTQTLPQALAASLFATPAGFAFRTPQTVRLTCSDAAATIHYTLDGSSPVQADGVTPAVNASLYGPAGIFLGTPDTVTTVNYYAVDGAAVTPVHTDTYSFLVTPPVVTATPSSAGGAVFPIRAAGLTVTLSANKPASLFYTFSPTATPNLAYPAGGIHLTRSPARAAITLRYMAVDAAGNQSAVRTSLYH